MGHLEIVLPIIGTAILGMGAFIMNNLHKRVDVVEIQLKETLTNTEARQIFDDKINPLREDIKDLSIRLDKVFDIISRK